MIRRGILAKKKRIFGKIISEIENMQEKFA
jgi:hypothetical protein